MSDMPYLGQSTDIILGQEFLTWLWYRSDADPASFMDKNSIPFTVTMEQRIVVQGGEGESLETASVTGPLSPLREARLGIAMGKKVTRALIRFEQNDLAWQCTLRAENLVCNSLKTPKIEKDDDDADMDALVLEKIALMEKYLELLDCVYVHFLRLRTSDIWYDEVHRMQQWAKHIHGQ